MKLIIIMGTETNVYNYSCLLTANKWDLDFLLTANKWDFDKK